MWPRWPCTNLHDLCDVYDGESHSQVEATVGQEAVHCHLGESTQLSRSTHQRLHLRSIIHEHRGRHIPARERQFLAGQTVIYSACSSD